MYMIIGRITGRTTTTHFSFIIEGDVSKYDFVQVFMDREGFILGQVIEIEATSNERKAYVSVLGIITDKGLKPLTRAIPPDGEVLLADKEAISKAIGIGDDKGLFIGTLRGIDVKVYLSLEKIMSKHLAILAKTGSGKSYTAGVIIEELLEHGAPVIIIDPHNEYVSINRPNNNPREIARLELGGLKPKGYEVLVYADPIIVPGAEKLVIPSRLSRNDLRVVLQKLTPTQEAILNEVMSGEEEIDILELRKRIEIIDNPLKNNLLSMIDHLLGLEIFTFQEFNIKKLVKPGRATILAFKGYPSEIQEIIVYKILSMLFEKRKHGEVPPFFLLIEEAHNYCPERGFGDSKARNIIRTIASEGRKFGIGLGVISQRPARVDKTVLSQCNTSIILKITNPNDLRAILSSLEGVYTGMDELIKGLQIGTAIISGALEVPIIVEIRPRKSMHGGSTSIGFYKIYKPNLSLRDYELMSDKGLEEAYMPCVLVEIERNNKDYKFLVSLYDGGIVTNIDKYESKRIPPIHILNKREISILRKLINKNIDTTSFPGEIEKLRSIGILDNNSRPNKQYIFENPFRYALKREPIYGNIDRKILEKRFSVEDILKDLNNLGKIKSYEECFLLIYS